MAKIGPRPDFARRYEDLEEQVRLLRLRVAKGVEPVEGWQSLAPYLDPNWLTDGTLGFDWFHARFYKDRERVYFAGSIEAQIAGSTSAVASMPVGYRTPMLVNQQLPVDNQSSVTGTASKVWIANILPSGKWALDDQHPDFAGSPLFGRPPQFTTFFLDGVSYRVTEGT